jgi:cytochrome c oxidase cbb3-type subunit 3/ubiquinol-cytochrome c reductase cytochrome c subunit
MVGAALASGCIKFGSTARRDGEDAGREAGKLARATADAEPGRNRAMKSVLAAGDAAPPPVDPVALAEHGKALYGKYCDFCHGKAGQGYAADEAPAIANEQFLRLADDEYLTHAIAKGRPGTTMSAWSNRGGGPLSDADVKAVVAFVRGWQKQPLEDVSGREAKGDRARGAPIYASKCVRCHGANGHEGKYIALGNADFLATASDGFIATTIERGRPGTPMIGFAGKIPAQGIADVTALVRSWQKPTEEITQFPPKPGALANVTLNPRGPQPSFDEKADFIPVDVVKRELARNATMIIADARAPSDFVRAHVAGAISVPFYQVKDYAPQIPKDRWIITYCACPHAASVKSRDAFRALGYKKVAVLDEGVLAWRDRGYPVRGGAKP